MATECENVGKARGKLMYNARANQIGKLMYNARANQIGTREGEGRRGYQGEERCAAQESNAIAI